MLNFEFYSPTRIVFGKGSQSKVGELVKRYSNKALLHYGSGSVKRTGLYDQVVASLKENGVEFEELGGVEPNPRIELVYKGIEICKEKDIGFILAVGGGSVIDSAKAIAAGYYYDGDIWDVYEKGLEFDEILPIATILTIPAAGSESSDSSVITNEAKGMKRSFHSDNLRPVFSIVNPELFFTLPRNQFAYGVTDMMSHIFERYFTNTAHTDLTDGLCEATLRTIIKNALIVKDDYNNYDAWAEIGFSGNVAHNGLLGMGREQDWGCHDMEHELSAAYDIPHGAGLAILTPAWMKYVKNENPEMFMRFARNVMGVDMKSDDQDLLICEAIDRLQEFFKALDLPLTLGDVGIGEDRLEEMAKKATHEEYGEEFALGGLKKLYWQDVLEIYKLAL